MIYPLSDNEVTIELFYLYANNNVMCKYPFSDNYPFMDIKEVGIIEIS